MKGAAAPSPPGRAGPCLFTALGVISLPMLPDGPLRTAAEKTLLEILRYRDTESKGSGLDALQKLCMEAVWTDPSINDELLIYAVRTLTSAAGLAWSVEDAPFSKKPGVSADQTPCTAKRSITLHTVSSTVPSSNAPAAAPRPPNAASKSVRDTPEEPASKSRIRSLRKAPSTCSIPKTSSTFPLNGHSPCCGIPDPK